VRFPILDEPRARLIEVQPNCIRPGVDRRNRVLNIRHSANLHAKHTLHRPARTLAAGAGTACTFKSAHPAPRSTPFNLFRLARTIRQFNPQLKLPPARQASLGRVPIQRHGTAR
jgi:hypothetical protein